MAQGFNRLEKGVRTLVEEYANVVSERDELRSSAAELRTRLAEHEKISAAREEKIRVLQAEVDRLKASRGDVSQRIDSLMTQIDLLDHQLSAEA